MQRVSLYFLFLLVLLCGPGISHAQEAFAPAGLYFQNQMIRKVSVGHNGIWVVKGADSTEVARLDFMGGVKDFSSTPGLNQPLTGIVGKYGERAMVTTKGSGLYFLKDGGLFKVEDGSLTPELKIKSVIGTPGYTRVSTGKGVYESYDNQSFFSGIEENEFQISKNDFFIQGSNNAYLLDTYFNNNSSCYERSLTLVCSPKFEVSSGASFEFLQFEFNARLLKRLHAVASNESRDPFQVEFLVGDESGLYKGASTCRNSIYLFLKDTAVYALQNYKNLTLVGTQKGLFYYTPSARDVKSAGRVMKVDLGGEYEVYDIQVQKEESIVWLATNKGLLKLVDAYPFITKSYQNNNIHWTKIHTGENRNSVFINSIKADDQGNIYQTGFFSGAVYFGSNLLRAKYSKDFYVAKLSPVGDVLWVRTLSDSIKNSYFSLNEEGFGVDVDSQGNVYAMCNLSSYNDQLMLKYDREGNILWSKIMPSSFRFDFTQFCAIEQGGGYYSYQKDDTGDIVRAVRKIDSDGNLIWEKTYPAHFYKISTGRDGKFYLLGNLSNPVTVGAVTLTPSEMYNLAIFQLDANGEAVWGNFVSNGYWISNQLVEVQADLHGNTYLGGKTNIKSNFGSYTFDNSHEGASYFLTKLNAAGEFQWLRYSEGTSASSGFRDLLVDGEGNSYITGTYEGPEVRFGNTVLKANPEFSANQIYLAKFNTQGENLWAQALPELYYINDLKPGKSLAITGGGVVIAASLAGDIMVNSTFLDLQGSIGAFLAHINASYIPTPFNLVKGKAFIDKNENNVFDEGDLPLGNNVIKAEPGPVFAKTDPQGNYELKLGIGQFTLEQIIPRYPDKTIIQTYPNVAYAVELNEFGLEKTGYDFAHHVEYVLQPYNLDFDISSTQFRRCFTSTTTVNVSNKGDLPAESASVVVAYPEYLIPLSSNIPWIKKEGNLLTFNISRLDANQAFSIQIRDSVRCGDETIRGLEQCVKAYLNYTDPTKVDPAWDQSDVELAAVCKDNGFVRVTMKNIGVGAMADSASYNIFLDQQKVYTGKYKLAVGEELSLNLLANGKPLLFVAALSPHHPQKKSVSLQIEGCTTASSPLISRSYESNLPADTLHENQKIVCLPIVDSYDPNDKLVMPLGITDNHNIKGDEYLTYTIRFQNTGTAPAINIRIVDVLDENLDLATLRIDAASHPMRWERQNNSLTWRFSNIYLPDSTSNEPGSHGFVKFRIKPKQALAKGTIIKNSADIYFDYNSPIVTNEVFHTIGLPEQLPGAKLVVQPCGTTVALAQEEPLELVLCGNSEYLLSKLSPQIGSGIWKVSKGSGEIADPYAAETQVSKLSYGENEFVWEVSYCDQKVMSRVTIIREPALEKPEVISTLSVCEGEPVSAITATGEGLEWYADASLTQLITKGNVYQPSGEVSEMLYVIKRTEKCISEPAAVAVVLHTKPAPPLAQDLEACVEVAKPALKAEGSRLRWYADAQKQQLLGEGNEFKPTDKNSSRYYVSQSSEHCESNAVEVNFTAKRFDPEKAHIANVVIPAGAKDNQQYWVKDFESKECLGEFISIKIYNRWGNIVFESNRADFHWDAGQHPTGVYYYKMQYQLQPFYGYIQVMR